MRVLITGATGNVGSAIIDRLKTQPGVEVTAGCFNVESARVRHGSRIEYAEVDFLTGTFPTEKFDAVFLMRPPQIADVDVFDQVLSKISSSTKIVFLSVQGADTKSYLPHAKIEKRIIAREFEHVFLRPSYFMENLTTTLWSELETNHRIYLPAGSLSLCWISVRDIAEIAAHAVTHPVKDEAIEICGDEEMDFQMVVDRINARCHTSLQYVSPFVLSYIVQELRSGTKLIKMFVMLLLHFFPRFVSPMPCAPSSTRKYLGRAPTSLDDFIQSNAERFSALRETTVET